MNNIQKSLDKLYALITGAILFRDYKSHGSNSKMWIDPKNRVIPLDGMHYEWLRQNAVFVRKAFNLPDMPNFGVQDEVPARLWALKNGFTRVNYREATGTVTFETNQKFWNKKRQDVISMLIADNADDIEFIVVNVLDDAGRVIKDGSADVRGLDEVAAKVEAIPVIPARHTKLIAEVLRRAKLVQGSTLTRVLRLMGRPNETGLDVEKPFAIVTAFQSGLEFEANQMRMRQMRDMLGRTGIKTYRLKGNWIEDQDGAPADDPEQNKPPVLIPEEAFFCAPKDKMSFEAFQTAVIRQADYFDQTACLLSDGQKFWVRFKDGHLRELPGHVTISSIQQAYQQMRDQKAHPFEFE